MISKIDFNNFWRSIFLITPEEMRRNKKLKNRTEELKDLLKDFTGVVSSDELMVEQDERE